MPASLVSVVGSLYASEPTRTIGKETCSAGGRGFSPWLYSRVRWRTPARPSRPRSNCRRRHHELDTARVDRNRSRYRFLSDGLVLCWRLAPSAIHLSRGLASRRRGQGNCSHQPTTIFDLRHLCLCPRAAGPSFCRRRRKISGRHLVDRTFTADPDECGIHEVASGICGVLRDGVVGQAGDRCSSNRMLPFLNVRPAPSADRARSEDDVLGTDFPTLSDENTGPFNDVSQFTNVPRPGVPL